VATEAIILLSGSSDCAMLAIAVATIVATVYFGFMGSSGARLLNGFPLKMVRLACTRCDRKGQYKKANLIVEYGASTPLPKLLTLIAKCDGTELRGLFRGFEAARKRQCIPKWVRSACRSIALFANDLTSSTRPPARYRVANPKIRPLSWRPLLLRFWRVDD
jgi:hypothetical protein